MAGKFFRMLKERTGDIFEQEFRDIPVRMKPFLTTSVLEAYLTHRCSYAKMTEVLRDTILFTVSYTVIAMMSHETDELKPEIRNKRIPSKTFIQPLCMDGLAAIGDLDAIMIMSQSLEQYDQAKWRGYDAQAKSRVRTAHDIIRWRIEDLEPHLYVPWKQWIDPRAHFLFERMIRAATYAEFTWFFSTVNMDAHEMYKIPGDVELNNLVQQESSDALRKHIERATKVWKKELPL